MAARNFTQAPAWCPNAVLTDRGWKDPKTGEVYVSFKRSVDVFMDVEAITETTNQALTFTAQSPTVNPS